MNVSLLVLFAPTLLAIGFWAVAITRDVIRPRYPEGQ